MQIKDFVESTKNTFSELFIQSRQAEFENFSAKIENKYQVAEQYRMHRERLSDLVLFKSGVVENVGFYKDVNPALAAFTYLRGNGVTHGHIQIAAEQLMAADLMKRHADEIIALADKELTDYQAAFAVFKKTNAAMLKELGLTDPTAD